MPINGAVDLHRAETESARGAGGGADRVRPVDLLETRFVHGDALRLADLDETFDAVTDSGLLHVFSDVDMPRVIRGVHAVLRPSGTYWVLCFSEHASLPGPRQLTEQNIATLFRDSWRVKRIEPAHFDVMPSRGNDELTAAARLVAIERI